MQVSYVFCEMFLTAVTFQSPACSVVCSSYWPKKKKDCGMSKNLTNWNSVVSLFTVNMVHNVLSEGE